MTRETALKVAKPILFNTDMVRAIQDNRKTVTRRLLKPGNVDLSDCVFVEMSQDPSELRIAKDSTEYPHDLKGLYATFKRLYGEYFPLVKVPYQVGDILYVRETWSEDNHNWLYRADFSDADLEKLKNIMRWAPSIHMPKKAARIFLIVKNVRVERLQDITPEQIEREGIYQDPNFNNWYTFGDGTHNSSQEHCFRRLWNGTAKKSDFGNDGWSANPWVAVNEFERLEVV